MNKLIIDSTNNHIEWDLQSVRATTAEWILEENFSSSKLVISTNTYKITSLDESITYAEIPIQLTVLRYI